MNCFSRFAVILSFILLGIGTATASESVLINPESENFGSISRGEMAYGSFSITSDSAENLSLKILAGCSCMSVLPPAANLASGESLVVNWTLDTEKYSGEVSFDVIIMGAGNPVYHVVGGTVEKKGIPTGLSVIIVAVSVLILCGLYFLRRRKRNQKAGSW